MSSPSERSAPSIPHAIRAVPGRARQYVASPRRLANLLGMGVGAVLAAAAFLVGAGIASQSALGPNPSNSGFTASQLTQLKMRLSAWRPESTGGDQISLHMDKVDDLTKGCRSGSVLDGGTERFHVRLVVASCESTWAAYDLTDNYASDAIVELHVTADRTNVLRLKESRRTAQAVFRLRANAFALLLSCSGKLDCRRQVQPLLHQLHEQLAPLELADPPTSGAAKLFITVPLTAWLLFVLPLRLLRRVRRPSYLSAPAPRYHDLTAELRGLERSRRWRPWLRRGGWILVALGIASLVGSVVTLSPSSLVGGSIEGVLGVGGLALARRLPALPPEPDERVLVEARGARAWWGTVATSSSTWLAGLMVAYFGIIAVMTATNIRGGKDAFYYAISGSGANPVQSVVGGTLALTALGFQDASLTIYLFAILPFLALAVSSSSLGRRLRAADIETVKRADQRAPILYLRAFEEDKLRVPATTLRRTLAQRLLARRTRRFEEVLAWSLTRYGPVTAISPPGARLPALGAAKTTLAHDEWTGVVAKMIDESFAVVMSGTPAEVKPGLATELAFIGNNPDIHLLVVQAPWRPNRLRRGWEAFCAAVARYPVLAPITWSWVQPGTQVLAHVGSGQDGWYAWGATFRTARSYELAIARAFEFAQPMWSQAFPPRSTAPTRDDA